MIQGGIESHRVGCVETRGTVDGGRQSVHCYHHLSSDQRYHHFLMMERQAVVVVVVEAGYEGCVGTSHFE